MWCPDCVAVREPLTALFARLPKGAAVVQAREQAPLSGILIRAARYSGSNFSGTMFSYSAHAGHEGLTLVVHSAHKGRCST